MDRTAGFADKYLTCQICAATRFRTLFSQPDIERIVEWAAGRGAKVLMSGDQEQLEAVESGGGMALLAGRMGYAKLAVPVRFAAEWEQDASLRLRAGDISVLTEYDQHGRIVGGEPERLLDTAAGQYVARYLSGADVLMMARSHEDCRELSRRVRDDLVHLGRVDSGRTAALHAGVSASAGDLIICRANANEIRVGLGEVRRLSNGDGLLVELVNEDGSLECRLALDADERTGERRFAEATFTMPAAEVAKADLAYCVTGNCVQGRTVSHGLAVFRGTESRGFAYVAMSRARHSNTALVTTRPDSADPRPGGRAAPELSRYDRIERDRQARLPAGRRPKDTTTEAIGVLAGCLERRDADDAALDVQRQELADADHLMALRVIFDNETARVRADRYAGMVRAALTAADHPAAVHAGHTARWLYRTLETAELAGRDPRRLLDQALAAGPLTGARDVVAVIDARLRHQAGPMVPAGLPSWSERVPQMSSPAMEEYLQRIALEMDDRTARLGPHTAETAPVWALYGLGPVPGDPAERQGWERRASVVAAYREAWGYHDEADPAGPEPSTSNPQQRAAWYGAMQALGPVDGVDVRGMTDGALLNARAVFERETAWAPRYVADELRQVRSAAVNAELQAIRADAEAKAAASDQLRLAHTQLADSARAMEAFYRATESELDAHMAVRREWAEATEHARRTAIASDSEYRRRHPESDLPPLVNGEPEPVSLRERDELDTGRRPAWLDRLAEQRQAAQAELDDRRSMRVPSEDPDADYDGQAWPELARRQRDAVLQPPKPEIQPSRAVLEAAREREAAREAG
ncbi:MAG TPA: AAA family ATPase [Streptosporangiaceae bacterium]|nr:AAA family ATPase [Streptosporangiaceae bacterium]